jgi:hypothetical protein
MRMNGEVSEREEKIFDHQFTHILKVMLCMNEKEEKKPSRERERVK